MSYDIYIGEAALDLPEHEEYADKYGTRLDGTRLGLTVHRTEHPEAPTFPNDELTGNSNSRHPGYSQWSEFCRTAGLEKLFFAKVTGLMSQHPGTFRLTKAHQAQIRERLSVWRATRSGDDPPGFAEWSLDEEQSDATPCDPILARLIWLDWWVTYALANCKIPAIHNH